MLSVAVAALACLCLARSSPMDTYPLRAYTKNPHNTKELTTILANIEERLRMVETISAVQAKQSRRLDVIHDKIDRMETTISLKLERAQLAADRMEHRLHMLQTTIQATIKENNEKIQQTQSTMIELTQDLTNEIVGHKRLLEKANGAYADTWRRGLLLENMMRDGLSLVNATRRELADGLRSLARRQRDKMYTGDLEASLARQIKENTYLMDVKFQEVLNVQKQCLGSCQRAQQDDPTYVADVLDKLIDSLINKTAATFKELQNIQMSVRNHDAKVTKLLTMRSSQSDTSCKRLESTFRNMSQSPFKETELQQLTEKFVALTDRADAALQRLQAKLTVLDFIGDEEQHPESSDVTAEADRLMLKLKGIKNDFDSDEDGSWMDEKLFDDRDYTYGKEQLTEPRQSRQVTTESSLEVLPNKRRAAVRSPHRRHLHKHPYDRGPTKLASPLSP